MPCVGFQPPGFESFWVTGGKQVLAATALMCLLKEGGAAPHSPVGGPNCWQVPLSMLHMTAEVNSTIIKLSNKKMHEKFENAGSLIITRGSVNHQSVLRQYISLCNQT